MKPAKAIFLDRDGTINKDSPFRIKKWEEFKFIPGAKKAIAMLTNRGFLIFIVTNQAGVAYGFLSESDLANIHSKMESEIKKEGGKINGIFCCLHHPNDACNCRKPKTGMLEKAAMKHRLDFSKSYMIGDKPADIEAGKRAGCKTVLVKTIFDKKYDGPEPDFTAKDILAAAEMIAKLPRKRGLKNFCSF